MTRWNTYPKNYRKRQQSAIPCQIPGAGEGEFMKEPDKPPKEHKYHAHKVEVDGITFDSGKEAKRYQELKTLERAGVISGLELQKKFVLIPTQREDDIIGPRGGVTKGKVIEKECAYYADFFYHDNEKNEDVVEDAKGHITQQLSTYRIKRKLLLYVHGIKIKEV